MKRFMMFVLVAMATTGLAGCGTTNPHARDLQQFGGTVLGAAGGYKAAGPLGALAGAVIGNKVVKAAQWNGNDDQYQTVVVDDSTTGQDTYAEPREAPRSRNMWQKVTRSGGSASKQSRPPVINGPTVDDYMDPKWSAQRVIPQKCQTGNYGHDGVCLIHEAEVLRQQQEACVDDTKKCNRYFNPGRYAKHFIWLGDQLIQEQNR